MAEMEKIIVIECLKRRMRAVVAEDGAPCEYIVEYLDRRSVHKDAIYVGRVSTIVRATQSAFVDIGMGKNAILHVEKGESDIHPGALVTVQIQREPPSPEKGPRVTRDIQLAGKLCVLSPLQKGIGISHKITDESQRERLSTAAKSACPQGMGIIVRTQAQDTTDQALIDEILDLLKRWNALEKKARGMTQPGCVFQNADLSDTLVRELLTPDVARVVCDDAQLTERLRQAAPQMSGRIECYTGKLPVFDAMQLETRLQKALSRKVLLKSGASLVIDPCEAMTVIDVNSGKNVTQKDAGQTALAVNLEAAEEIARQLRLRDMGGIIVVDFIDMTEDAHKEALLAALQSAVTRDRSRVRVGGLSPLGLCEMTRTALRRELREVIGRRCACCGVGYRVSLRERAYEVLAQVRRRAWNQGNDGRYLLTACASLSRAVEQIGEVFPCAALYFQAREDGDEEQFTLTQLPEGENVSAYEQMDIRSVRI